jgi:hypothetical protein
MFILRTLLKGDLFCTWSEVADEVQSAWRLFEAFKLASKVPLHNFQPRSTSSSIEFDCMCNRAGLLAPLSGSL